MDVERLRAETPGVAHRVHLNNAGASLMPRPVLEAMTGYLQREAEIGGYEAAAEAASRLDGVYDSIARLIGARRDEIAITENATVAWQMAFYALAATFRPGDRILTARAEYAANYVAFLQVARRTGAVIEVIPDDAQGVLDPAALQRHDRRPDAPDRHHLGADQRWAREPCGRGRPHRPGLRRALSPGRLPGGGPDAGRCRGARLRHARLLPAASSCAARAGPVSSTSAASFWGRWSRR